MKTVSTVFTLAAATVSLALISPIRADDKDKNNVQTSTTTKANLEKAQQVVRNIQQPEVRASSGTVTAQQVAQQQNRVEQSHQKEVAQKAHLDKPNKPIPAPTK
jgi:hypothetical protein